MRDLPTCYWATTSVRRGRVGKENSGVLVAAVLCLVRRRWWWYNSDRQGQYPPAVWELLRRTRQAVSCYRNQHLHRLTLSNNSNSRTTKLTKLQFHRSSIWLMKNPAITVHLRNRPPTQQLDGRRLWYQLPLFDRKPGQQYHSQFGEHGYSTKQLTDNRLKW